jgi:hypothetical protein
MGGSSALQAKVGINVTSPTVALQVSGTISTTALTVNGVTITGGGGSFVALSDVSYSSTGSNLFGPGSKTGAVIGVTRSTAFGHSALSSASNSGANNSAFGHVALAANTSGFSNSGFGKGSLQNNTTGYYNTAVGMQALNANVNGTYNTAMGSFSMNWSATGYRNTAIGYSVLGYANPVTDTVAIGFNAGNGTASSTAIDKSVLVGNYAGQALTTASNNILIGYNAGGGITAGSSNTVIGSNVSPYSNTGNNQLAIANAIYGDVGNGMALQAKVGINVTSPTMALDVSGSLKVGVMVSATIGQAMVNTWPGTVYAENGYYVGRNDTGIWWGDGGAQIVGNGVNDGNGYLWMAGGTSGMILAGGFMGVNTWTPNYTLDVAGVVAGAGAYVNTSDARLKKDVTPITYGLETVMKLKPIGFNWIDQGDDWKKQHQLGLIAQDVEKIVPEVVTKAKDASETRSLAYGELVPVLIKAVQDLKAENDALRARVDALERR